MTVNETSWHQSAVFYEVQTRTFFDTDGDGVGNIAGVTAKLDYLQWLGVDCLWLLPYYPSPLRDGGYDVSDYVSLDSRLGTLEEFDELIREAHTRGMKIIADLVLNHTSDQHPWFQDSRRGVDSEKSDWYVWSDDATRWPEARVIFTDVETSNWTYDEERGQFYWHRFYHHQPDLNLDHPAVVDALFDVVEFWLDRGLDGFRLDAVPYLFERDGTEGVHLPETHGFLRRLRRFIDDHYPGRILLAEANGTTSEVAAYFGDDDECHLCFNFPLMPRLFLATARGSAQPVITTLMRLPRPPGNSQWATFLRNHDELSLEVVSPRERDEMLEQFAPSPTMRRHTGIGRRLGPLLQNDRRLCELLTGLLLTLPGSPVLYYGDEILMGEDLTLPDRDPVRTPMQWNSSANGGFSAADRTKIYPPPLDASPGGYHECNVEAQMSNEESFLHYVRRALALRRQHPVLSVGACDVMSASDPSVLAFIREAPRLRSGDATRVLCVANFKGENVKVEIEMPQWRGNVLFDVNNTQRPPIPASPRTSLTLNPFDLQLFRLVGRHETSS